ncbi:MAG: YceI family protein [Sphingomonadaceae bacterium]|nr:YceI family protein [Sphingomonadaceae bacterium]
MRPALFLAALALAIPAAAQEPALPKTPPGAPIAARVKAGNYKVDGDHTQVLFKVNHLGFSEYSGQFTKPTGSLTLDPRNPARDRVEISFPINQVRTTVTTLDEHLQKPEFFDAARFPEGRFVSTRVTVKGMTAVIAGNLTLKGVTRPVVLNARFVGAGAMVMGPPKLNIGFSATTSIRRSAFGISYGVPLVSDRVDLVINAAFQAE